MNNQYLNFEYVPELNSSRFRRGNTISNYSRANFRKEFEFTFKSGELEEFPLCLYLQYARKPLSEKENGKIFNASFIDDINAFRNQTFTYLKVLDVLIDFDDLFKYSISNRTFILGKGFVAEIIEDTLKYYLVVTGKLKKDAYAFDEIDNCIVYMSRDIHTLPTSVKKAVQEYTKDMDIDIIYTKNVNKYLGIKLTIPAFKTLAERNIYLQDLFRKALGITKEIIIAASNNASVISQTDVEVTMQETL